MFGWFLPLLGAPTAEAFTTRVHIALANEIDAALVASGVVRRPLDGIKLLGKGELTSKLNLTVYAASAAAKAAVEKAGGTVTTTAPVDTGEPKGKLQKKVRA